jgi:hypothetical protein
LSQEALIRREVVMNKLASVFVVLLMVSAAPATTVTLVPIEEGQPGSATNPLGPSDTVMILVTTDNPLLAIDAVLYEGYGMGTIVDAMNPLEVWPAQWDPHDVQWPIVGGGQVEIGAGGFGPGLDIVGWYLLHCDGEGEVMVTLVPGQSFGGSMDINYLTPEIGGTITIHQIPEPVTAVILGLGGLALLRKRPVR